jgi:hypothetical protein
MKKNLIFVSCILLVFISCKKDQGIAPVNTISASIDGVDESFNTNPFAQLGEGITLNSSLSIFGTNGSTKGADVLSITMITGQAIVKGSYTSGNNSVGLVSIQYSDGPFSAANFNSYATDPNGNATTVVITSLTSTNVQGTFSGRLVYGSASKTVTNGKFNLTLN